MGIGEKYALGLSTYLHLVDGNKAGEKCKTWRENPKEAEWKSVCVLSIQF